MKKCFIIAFSLLPGLAAADVCLLANGGPGLGSTFYGDTNCGAGSVQMVTVVGDLDISGTTLNVATVQGEVDASSANVNTLTTTGILHANNSSFNSIQAGAAVYLNNSTAQNIVINGASTLGPDAVYINSSSHVGNITFSEGGGVVIESAPGLVSGTVTGGTIQVQSSWL